MSQAVEAQEYSHFFEVRLDLFNGPIDLLLHLVKQNELSIEKISLAQVADQYLKCIESIRQFDLDIAGEYLVIAATLVSVKSSLLLNEPVELVEDEDGNLVDPHEELLRRLREAAVYKQGAERLNGRAMLGLDVFAAPGTLDGVDAPAPRLKPHDSMLLGLAFKKMLEKAGEKTLYTVSVEQISVVDRMMNIIDVLEKRKELVPFYELVQDRRSRMSIIASFCALLELCKRQVIMVRQESPDGEIVIGLASADSAGNLDTMNLRSEFDDSDAESEEENLDIQANA